MNSGYTELFWLRWDEDGTMEANGWNEMQVSILEYFEMPVSLRGNRHLVAVIRMKELIRRWRQVLIERND